MIIFIYYFGYFEKISNLNLFRTYFESIPNLFRMFCEKIFPIPKIFKINFEIRKTSIPNFEIFEKHVFRISKYLFFENFENYKKNRFKNLQKSLLFLNCWHIYYILITIIKVNIKIKNIFLKLIKKFNESIPFLVIYVFHQRFQK